MSQINYQPEYRPKVKLLSGVSGLALSLVDSLLAKFCIVEVDTNSPNDWSQQTNYLKDNKHFSVNQKRLPDEDYIIVFLSLNNDKYRIDKLLSYKQNNQTKIIIVLPYAITQENKNNLVELKLFLKKYFNQVVYIYTGDLLGPRMFFEEKTGLTEIVKGVLTDHKILVPVNRTYYPIYIPEAAKIIVEILFSFNSNTRDIALYSEKIDPNTLMTRLSGAITTRQFSLNQASQVYYYPEVDVYKTNKTLEACLKEVFSWFANHPIIMLSEKQKPLKLKIKKTISIPTIRLPKFNMNPKLSKLSLAISILGVLLIMPLILLTSSVFILKTGYENLSSIKTANISTTFRVSNNLASLSYAGINLYSKVPIIGKVTDNLKQFNQIVINSSTIGKKAGLLIGKTENWLDKILGSEIYDPSAVANDIYIAIDDLYRDISFLDSEIHSLNGIYKKLLGNYFNGSDLATTRKYLLMAKEFAGKAPLVLGQPKPVNYLIIFQNNMELRPTGGFIGSYAIANFENGRLTKIDVHDVYEADGQLKGHIEPPAPIIKYLGEASWYLRDANWDPDFAVSSARIEWFLNKEVDQAVDGVISFDLEVAKSILNITGPIYLSDFKENISADNLYVKTQTEVESGFFPGSIKKASFLSAIAKELMNNIYQIKKDKRTQFLKTIHSLLAAKHIQIFLNDNQLQKIVSETGFSGEVLIPSCSNNCFSDWLGMVDANLGVNKVNYFVKRQANLKTDIYDKTVNHSLSIKFINSANSSLGLSGIYKNYFRLLLPYNASVDSVESLSGKTSEPVLFDDKTTSGKKEIGIYIEVYPGQTKELVVKWILENTLSTKSKGEYRLYWRKQAGTNEDPISISIKSYLKVGPNLWPDFSLTSDGTYVYNTLLTRDVFSRFSW